MILAMITAAGCGSRMNNAIPKQFICIDGKPIIIHTLTAFEKHPSIDAICVACLAGWEQTLADYAKKYNITKLRHIVAGGTTGQESIYIGLRELRSHYSDVDIVLIHDGVRPMVSTDIISDCISVTLQRGNAIAAIPCQEAVLTTTDGGITGDKSIERTTLRRTQTPHGFKLGDIIKWHDLARARGITNSVAACTMLCELGQPVNFSVGAETNIKLTTPDDFDIFRALLKVRQ